MYKLILKFDSLYHVKGMYNLDLLRQLYNMYVHQDFETIYHQKVSKTIARVLLLFSILFLVFSLKFFFNFTSMFNEFQTYMEKSPYFTIKNGELDIDASQPYYPIPGYKYLIVDTTGKTDSSVLSSMTDGILITKTKLYSKSSSYEVQSFDLSTINDISNLSSVTRNDITSWIMGIKTPLFFILEVLLALYQVIAKMIAVLILSLILMAVSSAQKKNINYKTLFSISAYSFAVPVILYWIRSLLGIYIPFFFIIYWAPAIIYGILGVRKYQEINPKLPEILPQ